MDYIRLRCIFQEFREIFHTPVTASFPLIVFLGGSTIAPLNRAQSESIGEVPRNNFWGDGEKKTESKETFFRGARGAGGEGRGRGGGRFTRHD